MGRHRKLECVLGMEGTRIKKTPIKIKMSDDEAPPVKQRKVNDKQMAGLRKGMEALKAKRESIAKEREEWEVKKSKGELPPDAPKPKPMNAPKPKVVKVPAPPPPEVIQVERKKRELKPNPMLGEMAALRAEVAALKIAVPAKEVVIEKEVDRVVHKDRVVTGSDMLNQIFGFK